MPAAVLINSIPTFVSLEEHKNLVASTPTSFSDIHAVLRHREENVSVTLDPPLDGFSSEDTAQGTLLVIESLLVFWSRTGRGFQIEYPSITLHAVSRTESRPSIYCQLDENALDPNALSANDEDVSDMRELTIVPQSADSLEPIFEAMSICAALHPDEATGSDDGLDDALIDGDEHAFEVFTGDADQELSEVGRAALAHLESIIYDPHNQMDDDDASPENAHAKDVQERNNIAL